MSVSVISYKIRLDVADSGVIVTTHSCGTELSRFCRILQAASNKLKKVDKGPTKGIKRKRTRFPSSKRQSTSRDRYPPENVASNT